MIAMDKNKTPVSNPSAYTIDPLSYKLYLDKDNFESNIVYEVFVHISNIEGHTAYEIIKVFKPAIWINGTFKSVNILVNETEKLDSPYSLIIYASPYVSSANNQKVRFTFDLNQLSQFPFLQVVGIQQGVIKDNGFNIVFDPNEVTWANNGLFFIDVLI